MRQDHVTAGRAADRLVVVGAAVFAAGAVATLATLASALLGWGRLPVQAYLLSMAMPVGFGAAFAGMAMGARRQPSAPSSPQPDTTSPTSD